MFFFRFLFSFFFFIRIECQQYIYTVVGGQHRWAPAFLAARHHIYFFHLLLYMSYLANKIVVLVYINDLA